MESSKGYDKVNPSDHPNSSPNYHRHRCRRRIIAVSFAVFLALVIGSLIAALIHGSATESKPQLASNSAESLKTVCAVTRYPDSCIAAISPLNSPPSNDPLRFFNLSLRASIEEASSLKSLLTEPEAEAAVKDCAELLDDAVSQLGRSAESIGGEKVLTGMKMSDLKTWISAAMTDQETCVDGLEEMGSTAVSEFKVKVQKSQEYLSNTLAILNNIQSLFHKFNLTIP